MTLLIVLVAALILGAGFWLTRLNRLVKVELGKAQVLEAGKLASLSDIAGFAPAVTFNGIFNNYGLAIDPVSEQFAIAIPGHSPRLYSFGQLVAAEVSRDDETVTSTKGKIDMSGAAVAAALVGPVGWAVGAKTSSESISVTNVRRLSLKLFVNDLHSPVFDIPFLEHAASAPASDGSNAPAIEQLDAWFGRFRTILLGLERSGSPDSARFVRYDAPAPLPVQVGWVGRVFAP